MTPFDPPRRRHHLTGLSRPGTAVRHAPNGSPNDEPAADVPHAAGRALRRLALASLLFFAPAVLAETYELPLFVASTTGGQQGVVRILNHSDEAGTVGIVAIDDAGTRSGAATLALGALEGADLDATDLGSGNAARGVTGGTGSIRGHVRLEFDTVLSVQLLAYLRTADGTLSELHGGVSAAASGEGGGHSYLVPTFNAAREMSQTSMLRLVNPTGMAATVSIRGRDDAGAAAAGGSVGLTLPAHGARKLTAQRLEAGGEGLTGQLGAGSGRWRLRISSDQPIDVISLVESSTGYLANLSTPGRGVMDAPPDTPPSFRDGSGPGDQTYTAGTAITALTLPEATGGDGALTHTLTPRVQGLTFDPATRELTGTPASAGTHPMTYTATDANGDTATLGFTITVRASDGGMAGAGGDCHVGLLVSPGESCTYPGTDSAFSVDEDGRGRFLVVTSTRAINLNKVTYQGTFYDFRASHQGDGVWRIDRIDSGTEAPTAPPSGGGGEEPENSSPILPAADAPGDQTYTVGTAIAALTLPPATGGDGALTYTLTPGIPGLAFDAATRQLAGTPTAEGTHPMTYTVADADGDTDTLSFTIAVEAGGEMIVTAWTVGDALPDVPADRPFAPAAIEGGSTSTAGGVTTITLGGGGHFELDDGTRYTCSSADGCAVENGTVTRGAIRAAFGDPAILTIVQRNAPPEDPQYTIMQTHGQIQYWLASDSGPAQTLHIGPDGSRTRIHDDGDGAISTIVDEATGDVIRILYPTDTRTDVLVFDAEGAFRSGVAVYEEDGGYMIGGILGHHDFADVDLRGTQYRDGDEVGSFRLHTVANGDLGDALAMPAEFTELVGELAALFDAGAPNPGGFLVTGSAAAPATGAALPTTRSRIVRGIAAVAGVVVASKTGSGLTFVLGGSERIAGAARDAVFAKLRGRDVTRAVVDGVIDGLSVCNVPARGIVLRKMCEAGVSYLAGEFEGASIVDHLADIALNRISPAAPQALADARAITEAVEYADRRIESGREQEPGEFLSVEGLLPKLETPIELLADVEIDKGRTPTGDMGERAEGDLLEFELEGTVGADGRFEVRGCLRGLDSCPDNEEMSMSGRLERGGDGAVGFAEGGHSWEAPAGWPAHEGSQQPEPPDSGGVEAGTRGGEVWAWRADEPPDPPFRFTVEVAPDEFGWLDGKISTRFAFSHENGAMTIVVGYGPDSDTALGECRKRTSEPEECRDPFWDVSLGPEFDLTACYAEGYTRYRWDGDEPMDDDSFWRYDWESDYGSSRTEAEERVLEALREDTDRYDHGDWPDTRTTLAWSGCVAEL